MKSFVIKNQDGLFLRFQADCGGYDIELNWGIITNATLFALKEEAEDIINKELKEIKQRTSYGLSLNEWNWRGTVVAVSIEL